MTTKRCDTMTRSFLAKIISVLTLLLLFGVAAPTTPREDVDFDGHNREWWQARVSEWKRKKTRAKQRLANASERLNTVPLTLPFLAREKKEREIRQKIQAYKAKAQEAEQMLNEVLPEKARKAGAPPGWLRE